jgi:hypothetical protein
MIFSMWRPKFFFRFVRVIVVAFNVRNGNFFNKLQDLGMDFSFIFGKESCLATENEISSELRN